MSKLDFMSNLLKNTEVEWKTLGDIFIIYGGLTGKSKNDFEDGNASYIPYKNIFYNIAVDFDNLEAVKISNTENQREVKYGDILFTGSSESPDEAGMSSAITQELSKPIYLNSFSFGVRFNSDIKINPHFSKYLFRSHFMRKEIIKTASGVTRFNISKARFKKLQIPIPPLNVQAEIVRILDAFTKLTAELTVELVARKQQYAYYRDQLLTFEEDRVEWRKLEEVCEKISSGKNKVKSELGLYPVFGSTGIIGRTDTKVYEKEQILVARVGANAGRVNIAKGEYDVSDNTLIVQNKDNIVLKFLYYYLVNINLNRFTKGAGQPLLTAGQLKTMLIPLPSLTEQQRIVTILDKFDALTTSLTEGLPREIELRQQQYEYYRELLLSFPKAEVADHD